jgi:hypothetical protein
MTDTERHKSHLTVGEKVIYLHGWLIYIGEVAEVRMYAEGETYAFAMYRLRGAHHFDTYPDQTYGRFDLYRLNREELELLAEKVDSGADALREIHTVIDPDDVSWTLEHLERF